MSGKVNKLEKRSWVIDICRYCGAKAVHPGCEHWRLNDHWTVPVVVSARVWLIPAPAPSNEETE